MCDWSDVMGWVSIKPFTRRRLLFCRCYIIFIEKKKNQEYGFYYFAREKQVFGVQLLLISRPLIFFCFFNGWVGVRILVNYFPVAAKCSRRFCLVWVWVWKQGGETRKLDRLKDESAIGWIETWSNSQFHWICFRAWEDHTRRRQSHIF